MEVQAYSFSTLSRLSPAEKATQSIIVFLAITAIGFFVISQIYNDPTTPFTHQLSWIYLAAGVSLALKVIAYLGSREDKPLAHKVVSPSVERRAAPAEVSKPPQVIMTLPSAPPKRYKLPQKALVPYKKAQRLDEVPEVLILHIFTFLKNTEIRDLALTSKSYWLLFQNPQTTKIILSSHIRKTPILAQVARRLNLIYQKALKEHSPLTLPLQNLPTMDQIDKRNFTSDQLSSKVQALQSSRAHLEVYDPPFSLEWCAGVGYIQGVEIFLPNATALQTFSALKSAIKGQHELIVKRLLGAVLTQEQGIEILNHALTCAHIDLFQTLFETFKGFVVFAHWIDLFKQAAAEKRNQLFAYLLSQYREIVSTEKANGRRVPENIVILKESFKTAVSTGNFKLMTMISLHIKDENQMKSLVYDSLSLVPEKRKNEIILWLLKPVIKSEPMIVIEKLASQGYGIALSGVMRQVDISRLDHGKMIVLFQKATNIEVIKGFQLFYDYIPIEMFLTALSQLKDEGWHPSQAMKELDGWLSSLEEIPGRLSEGEKLNFHMLQKISIPSFPRYYQKLTAEIIRR